MIPESKRSGSKGQSKHSSDFINHDKFVDSLYLVDMWAAVRRHLYFAQVPAAAAPRLAYPRPARRRWDNAINFF
jgi:hypothetical protein